jgi:hypothetical protein
MDNKTVVATSNQFDRRVEKLVDTLHEAMKMGATHYEMAYTGNDPSWPDAWWLKFYYVKTEKQRLQDILNQKEEEILSLKNKIRNLKE